MRTRATWVLTVVSLTTSSLGDLGVRQAARHQLEDLELARGQLVEPLRRARAAPAARAANSLDEAAGDRRGQQRVAAGDDADARGELLGRDVLEQEPAGPGAQRLVDVLVRVEGREHQDAHGVLAGLGERPGAWPRCRRAPASGCP